MRALKSWINWEHEGVVVPERIFEANEYRARDLIRLKLAIAVMGVGDKIKVPSDPPPAPRRRSTKRVP